VSKVRILFLGTADFAVPALNAAAKDEHYDIVQVITQPDRPAGRKLALKKSPVKVAAETLNLPVFTPEKINTPEVLAQIKSYKADVAVVIAYGQILSQDFLDSFQYGAVNVHGSLLPRWRGAAPVQRAIMAGDIESGVCLQKIVKKLDAGDVLGQRRLKITDEMTASDLYEALKLKAAELIHIELMDYIRGNLSGKKQDDSLVTIAEKIKKEEGLIDFTKTSNEVYNQFKALSIWPGVWTYITGKKIKVIAMQNVNNDMQVGQIEVAPDKSAFYIGCKVGAIKVSQLQMESKAKMQVKDFLNGFELPKQID